MLFQTTTLNNKDAESTEVLLIYQLQYGQCDTHARCQLGTVTIHFYCRLRWVMNTCTAWGAALQSPVVCWKQRAGLEIPQVPGVQAPVI